MTNRSVTRSFAAGWLAAPIARAAIGGAGYALLAAAAPHLAHAQARIANHANGLAYQPTQGEVSQAEQAAGVAPAHPRRLDEEIDDLDRQLLQSEGAPTNSVPPVPAQR